MSRKITFMYGQTILLDGEEVNITSVSIGNAGEFILNGRVDFKRIPIRLDHLPDGQILKVYSDHLVLYIDNNKYKVKYLDELQALGYVGSFIVS